MEKLFLEHPWIIILILLWTLPWKGAALWRAARRGHVGWFLTLLVLNTFAILDIIYIFIFSIRGASSKQEQEQKQGSHQEISRTKFQSNPKNRMTIM